MQSSPEDRSPVDAALQWLAARPVNGVFGLLALASLPLVGMFSSALLVMLVLSNGLRTAIIQALITAGLLGVASLLSGNNPAVVAVSMGAIWAPGLVLVTLLMATRSLALTLQISVIAMAVVIGLIFAVATDPTAFWEATLSAVAAAWREQGQEDMASVVEQLLPYAEHMTLTIVLTLWIVHSALFTLGYALAGRLPGAASAYGRFAELSLGKVIAILMAVSSLVAMLVNAILLKNLAFLFYAVFWLQGLALLHWLHAEKKIPAVLLIFAYASLVIPPINAIALMVLALVGYADAWFNFRRPRPA